MLHLNKLLLCLLLLPVAIWLIAFWLIAISTCNKPFLLAVQSFSLKVYEIYCCARFSAGNSLEYPDFWEKTG